MGYGYVTDLFGIAHDVYFRVDGARALNISSAEREGLHTLLTKMSYGLYVKGLKEDALGRRHAVGSRHEAEEVKEEEEDNDDAPKKSKKKSSGDPEKSKKKSSKSKSPIRDKSSKTK